jgi:Na+/H+ antiporter NhaD/arsenite permease-like protein
MSVQTVVSLASFALADVALEQARRRGVQVSAAAYMRVGIPVTVLTLAVDLALLALSG